MRRKPGNWRACTDAETCEANVPTLGGNYQGGEGPLEQRRTSGGNGGVDAAHLPLGMSARGGANSPRVVYASGAENLGPPKANGHYHPSQALLRWSSAAPAVPRRPCAPRNSDWIRRAASVLGQMQAAREGVGEVPRRCQANSMATGSISSEIQVP